jgi:CRP/FNR family transcriptional regulator, cyclic AMP receptor protein
MRHAAHWVRDNHPRPLFPDWALAPLPSAAEDAAIAAARLAARLRSTLPDNLPLLELPAHKSLHMTGQQDSGNLYLIEYGIVKQQNLSINGKSSILTIFAPHDLIGDSRLIRPVRTDTLTTLTPALLRQVSQAKLRELTADPEFARDWLCCKISRDLEQQEQISLFISYNSEHRLGWLLLTLACKIGTPTPAGIVIDNLLTHEDLAQMIGTTRSRVGSFLKGFRLNGLIRAADNSTIIDHFRLRDYLHMADNEVSPLVRGRQRAAR